MLTSMLSNAERDIFEPVTLDQLVGEGQELPSLPAVFRLVTKQLDDHSYSLEQIGNTLQNDPAITTRILKLVNSSYYGLPGQIGRAHV